MQVRSRVANTPRCGSGARLSAEKSGEAARATLTAFVLQHSFEKEGGSMPQPDSSRNPTPQARWNPAEGRWPIDPELPRRGETRGAARTPPQPKGEPEKDGRTPDDRDGNEELEREVKEDPQRRRSPSGRDALQTRHARNSETDDTSEWVATQPFTLEDELDDTWPNVPARYLEQ